MRLSIDHHTTYRFSVPQARVVQLLRVTPSDFAGQTVIDWRIDVDCDARLRSGEDGYGNPTTMLYIEGPIEKLDLTVRGEVLTEDQAGVVRGAHEPLPPLYFRRETPTTSISDAICTFARRISGSDPLERIHMLNTMVGSAMTIEAGRGTVGRSADEVLSSKRGSTRDAAHLLIAAARGLQMPARIVSGHSLNGPDRGHRRSTHYWAEVHVDRLGWVALDPSSGFSPDESYVRVAVGLDAYDATPVSGTRTGGGLEELDVAVHVEPVGAQQQ
ncbi:MAG: transglutaminase family protein [Pseudomonadota bacterium]